MEQKIIFDTMRDNGESMNNPEGTYNHRIVAEFQDCLMS